MSDDIIICDDDAEILGDEELATDGGTLATPSAEAEVAEKDGERRLVVTVTVPDPVLAEAEAADGERRDELSDRVEVLLQDETGAWV